MRRRSCSASCCSRSSAPFSRRAASASTPISTSSSPPTCRGASARPRWTAPSRRTSDLLAIVIDAKSPDLAGDAADALAKRLAGMKELFRTVREPEGGPFFRREGVLFLPLADVAGVLRPDHRGAAHDRHAGRRSEPARNFRRARSSGEGRGSWRHRQGCAREPACGGDAVGRCRASGRLCAALVADHAERAHARPARAAPLRADAAGAGLQPARARRARRHSHSRRRPIPRPHARARRQRALDRPGRLLRRPARDAVAWRGLHHGAVALAPVPVAFHGAALAAAGRGDHRDASGRARRLRHLRVGRGRAAQSDLGRLCRAVHRPRGRFRHPVQRALSRRAVPRRRSPPRARSHRGRRRPAAGRGGGGDIGRILLVRADGLHRRVGFGPHRRDRHADRARAQPDAAAGAARALEAARRTPRGRICAPRAAQRHARRAPQGGAGGGGSGRLSRRRRRSSGCASISTRSICRTSTPRRCAC